MSRALSLAGPDRATGPDAPGMEGWLLRGVDRVRQIGRDVAAAIVPLLPAADASADPGSVPWEAAQVLLMERHYPARGYQTIYGTVLHALRAGVARDALAEIVARYGMRRTADALAAGSDLLAEPLRLDMEEEMCREAPGISRRR